MTALIDPLWSWTARAARPVLSCRTVPISCCHAAVDTAPVALRPCDRWKAMTAALVLGPLARHVQTGIRTGLTCSYEPDPADNLDWILDWEPTEA